MFQIIDLFAGIGGIALGFKRAGFEIAWSNEIDTKACQTYRTNFSHDIFEEDIKNLNPKNLKKADIITAGFPCQSFSIAGYRKGFGDERGNVFFEIMRFVDEFNPKVVFLENVKNLKTHDKGNTFKIIENELKKRGYFVKHQVLNTCEYSFIPQNRERIYILAFKDKQAYNNFEFPSKVSVQKNIWDLLDDTAPDNFYYNNTKYYETLKKEMTNPNTIYQWRRVYLRENKNGLCPTLTANMGTGGHNVPLILDKKDIRKLTPRECARFQGFDDSFILPENLPNSALYKQIGNSVSVPVIEKIAINIRNAIITNFEKDNYVYRETA